MLANDGMVEGEIKMIYIVVDDKQASVISSAAEDIEIRDRNGKRLGIVSHGFSHEDIAIAQARKESDEPRFTTSQVREHLEL